MQKFLESLKLKDIVKKALKEDIGSGDITTRMFVPPEVRVGAVIIAKEKGVACGIEAAGLAFKLLDKKTEFFPLVKDGDALRKGQALAKIRGLAVSILPAERVALNFLGLLSGIATRTRQFRRRLNSRKVKILDTRKTLPGLRELEKYAVTVGGGFNHRMGLDKMILLKDNHIQAIGGRFWAGGLKKIRNKIPSKVKIEIEVRTIQEFKRALELSPDIIMLDNMGMRDIRKALKIRNALEAVQQSSLRAPKGRSNPELLRLLRSRFATLAVPRNDSCRTTTPSRPYLPKIEVSGNAQGKNLARLAGLGVDFISLGTLTKDVLALDISLEIVKSSRR